MDRQARFKTIKGQYTPSDLGQHLWIEHDGMPDLALIAEPIKLYNDNYDGIVFYKRVENTEETFGPSSQFGGSSIPKHGFSRSPNF